MGRRGNRALGLGSRVLVKCNSENLTDLTRKISNLSVAGLAPGKSCH
ncbi:hypothetical protein HMPREF3150_04952 [Pseudomonas aeruginosa]|nr:hypothetical protein HMPREF3150_04952 [Pseudomonas aeruginosa]